MQDRHFTSIGQIRRRDDYLRACAFSFVGGRANVVYRDEQLNEIRRLGWCWPDAAVNPQAGPCVDLAVSECVVSVHGPIEEFRVEARCLLRGLRQDLELNDRIAHEFLSLLVALRGSTKIPLRVTSAFVAV